VTGFMAGKVLYWVDCVEQSAQFTKASARGRRRDTGNFRHEPRRGNVMPETSSNLTFGPDVVAALVEMALEQSKRENALRQELKEAVARKDMQEVFRLADLLTGGDGFITATV
jgi:hypothetical protein